jgi:hypothetical protein
MNKGVSSVCAHSQRKDDQWHLATNGFLWKHSDWTVNSAKLNNDGNRRYLQAELSEFSGFWQILGALLMHLIPTAVVLVALAIAWRWESVGGILFILLGLLYLVWSRGQLHWTAYAVIAGPLFLVGILFLVNWWHRARLGTSA